MHIPIKKKKKKVENSEEKIEAIPIRKKYSPRGWVVERTNSWHNRFRKLCTQYEKKVENYLGLVQFSCCIIIYRKIILGQALNMTSIVVLDFLKSESLIYKLYRIFANLYKQNWFLFKLLR